MNLLRLARVQSAIISLTFFFAVAAAAWAETLEVPQGQALSLKLDARANTVAVGDEKIADARVAFGDTIVLIGKDAGMTNLIVFDQEGAEFFSSVISVVSSLDSRNVTIIAGTTRRTLICGPTRCVEQRVPDQVIERHTHLEGENITEMTTREQTMSR